MEADVKVNTGLLLSPRHSMKTCSGNLISYIINICLLFTKFLLLFFSACRCCVHLYGVYFASMLL